MSINSAINPQIFIRKLPYFSMIKMHFKTIVVIQFDSFNKIFEEKQKGGGKEWRTKEE